MNLDEEKLAHLFTEWDERYRKNPDKYWNEVDHLLHNTPYSYGVACARYFKELYEDFY